MDYWKWARTSPHLKSFLFDHVHLKWEKNVNTFQFRSMVSLLRDMIKEMRKIKQWFEYNSLISVLILSAAAKMVQSHTLSAIDANCHRVWVWTPYLWPWAWRLEQRGPHCQSSQTVFISSLCLASQPYIQSMVSTLEFSELWWWTRSTTENN